MPILLTPGPVLTTPRVRGALLGGDLCHREPEFAELLGALRTELAAALEVQDSHEAVLLTGSGTAAMESALISSVRPGRSALVVNNGVYGDRMAQIATAHGIGVHQVRSAWTEPVDPDAVRIALRRHADVDAVVCVQHETTTGLLNPVAEIGSVVAGTGAVFVVDAISALGAERPTAPAVRADVLCGTANKALHGLPGVSFLLLSAKALARVAAVPPRSLYLSVRTYLAQQRRGEVPFTPAIPACYALLAAVREFGEEGGYAGRSAEYRRRAGVLRTGLAALGLHPLVAESDRASSVTAFPLPAGLGFGELHGELRRRGFVIYAAQGPLASTAFRVAVMGALPQAALERFVEAIADTIADTIAVLR